MPRPSRPLTEGERWAREELAALVAARFSPPAVARFLVASQRRANEVRRARPATARRAWAWSAAGGAAWATLALSGAQPFRRRLRESMAWWALVALMLDWHLGMVETEDGRARTLGAADACTLARCWLVPVVLDRPVPAACLTAFATDGLDGWLARRAEPTRAGRDLEGLVDACFAAAALHAAMRRGLVARTVVAGELARLAAGLGYALYVYFGRVSAPDPRVTRAGRVTTPVRGAGLVAAGLRRRGVANALLAAGAAWSVIAVGRALRRPAAY